MSILPSNTYLGKLKITEVYDYYEGPKFFCVKNQFRQIMVVYWVDHKKDNNSYGWLYLPITDEKLNELRRGKISVRNAYEDPEQGLYLVYTQPKTSKNEVEYYEKDQINKKFLPPKNLFITPEDIDVVDDREANWVYELYIKKSNSDELLTTRTVTSVLNAFREIIEQLMKTDTREQPKIYPLSAVPGSFNLKIVSSNNKKAMDALEKFQEIIKSNNNNILDILKKLKLDPFILKILYEVIYTNNIDIVITPKTFDHVTGEIKVQKSQAKSKLSKLEKTTFNIIESIKVPQANDIDKVIKVVELKKRGKKITYDLIDGLNSNRQVKYYTDAAFSLGLLTRDGYLTSAGRFLISKKSIKSRYQVLADRFETSDFGWAWMNWSNVTSINELDPDTASEFIKTSVPDLGSNTANRRSTTLIKWLKVLAPYHRNYHK